MSRSTRENLIGRKFGTLLVVSEAEDYIEPKSGAHRPRWNCLCDCGNLTKITSGNLRKGAKSCGCLTNKIISEANSSHNIYDLSGEFGKGWDTCGHEFWFDLEDYDLIAPYYWRMFNNGYFVHTSYQDDNVNTIQIHRLIMGIENEDYRRIVVDHIHGSDTLYDNRKTNLRIATRRQNSINKRIGKNNTSGVNGVYWNNSKHKWIAMINDTINHRLEFAFDNFNDAVAKRVELENLYYKEFVSRNRMIREREVII